MLAILMMALVSHTAMAFVLAPKATSPLPATRMPPSSWSSLRAASDGDEEGGEDPEGGEASRARYRGYNVIGTELQCCCSDVGGSGIGTGFYRNGMCSTGDQDLGRHTVCVEVTDEFLAFSRQVGNDLSTPVPEYMFPGLKGGDIWCLCAQVGAGVEFELLSNLLTFECRNPQIQQRWAQAYNEGKAPKLYLQATHEKTLEYVPLEVLRMFALDGDESKLVIDELTMQRDKLDELLKKDSAESDSFQ